MNERIRQLALQAGMVRGGYANTPERIMTWREDFDNPGSLEKFAELIVAECMRMCDVADMSLLEHNCVKEASGTQSAKDFIKEHFEVEE
jgi:hypothetical protein